MVGTTTPLRRSVQIYTERSFWRQRWIVFRLTVHCVRLTPRSHSTEVTLRTSSDSRWFRQFALDSAIKQAARRTRHKDCWFRRNVASTSQCRSKRLPTIMRRRSRRPTVHVRRVHVLWRLVARLRKISVGILRHFRTKWSRNRDKKNPSELLLLLEKHTVSYDLYVLCFVKVLSSFATLAVCKLCLRL